MLHEMSYIIKTTMLKILLPLFVITLIYGDLKYHIIVCIRIYVTFDLRSFTFFQDEPKMRSISIPSVV